MGDFEFQLVAPVICLAGYGLLTMLLVPFQRGTPRWLALSSLVGLLMTGYALVRLWTVWRLSGPQETAFGMVHIDGFGLYLSFVIVGIGILATLISMAFLEREGADSCCKRRT
jgi:NADH:ubiquinone oxidoreductase subunit 2 (subunit N)